MYGNETEINKEPRKYINKNTNNMKSTQNGRNLKFFKISVKVVVFINNYLKCVLN